MSDPRIPAPQRHGQILYGRAREQQRLHEHLFQTIAGSGSLAFVSGEAGIGKTALVNVSIQQAIRNDVQVMAGHCYDLSSTPPYGPWIELLDDYRGGDDLPPLPPGISDEAGFTSITNRDAFFQQTLSFFIELSDHKPLLIVLEDLHWVDPASLDLLRFLARRLSRYRILVVATYRNDELDRGNPLYQLMPVLVRESTTHRLSLHRLGQPAIRDYVGARYPMQASAETRLGNYLKRMTDGNPFLLEELLHTLEDERLLYKSGDGWSLNTLDNVQVPALIHQVVDRRLDQLSEPAIDLLEVAAIIGGEVPVDLWKTVSDRTDEELATQLEQILASRLIEETSQAGRFRFRHALVRQALYERTLLVRRQAWHRRVAETISESSYPAPDSVAYHFQEAGDPRAVEWLIEAGERAQNLYAPRAAIRQLSAAFTLGDRFSIDLPLHAYRARGMAHETAGDFASAHADYLTTLQMARHAGESQTEWQASIDLGMLWAERDYVRAGMYLTAALELARDTQDRATLAHSLNRMGNWHLNVERPAEAAGCHEEALQLFGEINDRSGIAATLDLLGMASYLSGDLVRGTGHFSQAVQLFTELGDRQGLASSLATLTMRSATYQTSTMIPGSDLLARSALDGEQALEVAREIGWRAGEAYALWMLAFSYGSQGDYGRALEAGHLSLQIAEQIEHRQWMTSARFTLGGLYLDLLAREPARMYLEQASEMARLIGSAHWTRATTGFLASACITQGDLDRAEAVLDDALAPDTPAQTLGQRLAWCGRAELALARNRANTACEIIERIATTTPNISGDAAAPRLSALYGEALLAGERLTEAESALLDAQTAASKQGAAPMLWRIRLQLGKLYGQRADMQRASLMFSSARETIAGLATQIPDDELRGNFLDAALVQAPQALPLTPLQEAKLTYDGLTARQRDVASLIAQGKANREIADQLSLSKRTVETHVSHILTTLDASSRSQIAVWAVEKGLADTR